MFDKLLIPNTGMDARRDNFVTIDGNTNLNILYEEGKTDQLIIVYGTVRNYEGERYAFWQDMII